MIRWGIIGCGDVTEIKSGPGFQNARESSLVAVMRRTADKARDYAERHHVARWYDDADELINDPEVDAVSIATPPSSHLELALKVCAAGKPAYVEKPMAVDHAQCVEMVDAFRQADVPLFVAYYRRGLPRFHKIRSLIEAGAVGCVLSVNVTHHLLPAKVDASNLPWRFVPEIAGGGLFVDLGSHTLDVLDFLFGRIVRVGGFAAKQGGCYEVEDAIVMSFEHESGVQGVGAWHFNSWQQLDRVEVAGTEGTLTFSIFGDSAIRLETRTNAAAFNVPNPQAIQQPLIQTIVDELQGQGQCPSTGTSAARTNWVMDQVLAGYRMRQQ